MKTAEEKGRAEGRMEVARELLKLNTPIDTIVKATGLSPEDIQKIGE